MTGERLQSLLQDAIAAGDIPGAVAMVAGPEGVTHAAAAGPLGLGIDAPMALDSVFAIASMTKAITGVAAMQMVERGLLQLDSPAGEIIPALAAPQVLTGFDAAGQPMLRPARGTVTLRNLLTHTAGFSYAFCDPLVARYDVLRGIPSPRDGRLAALEAPLIADPGTQWQYGIGIDFAGRMVEAVSGLDLDAYMRRHILDPLGMVDTGFLPDAARQARLAGQHTRAPDGSLHPAPQLHIEKPEFFVGGGGLYGTAPDYIRFLRMLLCGGTLDGARILGADTVAEMMRNHIGPLTAEGLRTAHPTLSNDFLPFPGITKTWGLTFLINEERTPAGRSAGSIAWGGLRNTYYWLDPHKRRAGVLMTQILPFADPRVLDVFDRMERLLEG